MLSFLQKYADNGPHSQNGESGILTEALARMGISTGYAIEVGGADGLYCSNIALLLKNGWRGLFVESDWNLYQQCKANWEHNPNVRAQCCHVDGKNISAFVDDRCDVLSTDTDGADFDIFKGLKAKPKIVIVEIDSSIPPGDEGFNSDGAAGYRTMTELGISKGYFLLCHTGNLIFIDMKYRKLFPEIVGDGLNNASLYFNQSWLKKEAA